MTVYVVNEKVFANRKDAENYAADENYATAFGGGYKVAFVYEVKVATEYTKRFEEAEYNEEVIKGE